MDTKTHAYLLNAILEQWKNYELKCADIIF